MDTEKYKELQEERADSNFKQITYDKLQKLHFIINDLTDKIGLVDAKKGQQLKDFEIEISKVKNSCEASLKEFRGCVDELQSCFTFCKSWLRGLENLTQEFVSKNHLRDQISQLKEVIVNIQKENESKLKDLNVVIERIKLDSDYKFNAFKQEILSIPSQIPELKEYINQKVELAELNGQNSILRSSNNEKQIQLIERKIEQIYQLIKSSDLNNRLSQ